MVALANALAAAAAVVAVESCSDPAAAPSGTDDAAADAGVESVADASADALDGAEALDSKAPNELRVYAGGWTSCVVAKDETVKCWGRNDVGQLGVGTSGREAFPSPVLVPGLAAVHLGISTLHLCAVTTTGSVACWGQNHDGELGHDPALEDDAGDAGHCDSIHGVRRCSRIPTLVSGLSGVVRAAAGERHSCAQVGEGISCWGKNRAGVLGLAEIDVVSFTPNALALGQVVELESGNNSGCARRTDGSVWCWGQRWFGEIGRPSGADASIPSGDLESHPVPWQVDGLTSTLGVTFGLTHACAIRSDRTVACWGLNDGSDPGVGGGQLGHDPASDPTCNGWKCNDVPTAVAGASDVRELALGHLHTCALRGDGTVLCWGTNDRGQLGHDPALDADGGAIGPAFTPRPVTGLSNVTHIAAGYDHTCAVTKDEKVFCWGSNSYGALGVDLETAVASFTPLEVSGL